MEPTEETKKLGKLIERTRLNKGISEYEFAQALDESVYYVRQAESGNFNPYIGELINIVRALDVTLPEFFSGFED